MIKTGFLYLLLLLFPDYNMECNLPINSSDRKSIDFIRLTDIGEFGLLRKERPGVPSHYHTGIDIKRPSNNYHNEPIFAISEGRVISIRKDGPYAQVIIEHGDSDFWTVYEHIAGIRVELYQQVNPNTPIARFMNKEELHKYGWQFDHFHFEVLKIPPTRLKKNSTKPFRLFSSYTLACYTKDDLKRYFYDPIEFLKKH